MGNLNLAEAFAAYGGKASNRLHSLSAMAPDGAMILGCSAGLFGHPSRGILRYQDQLSRVSGHAVEAQSLGQHLTLARDGSLPIRLIVITEKPDAAGKVARSVHVRKDLVGKVIEFDGDRFTVDFVRAGEPMVVAKKRPSAAF